jgi:hypothetical protein
MSADNDVFIQAGSAEQIAEAIIQMNSPLQIVPSFTAPQAPAISFCISKVSTFSTPSERELILQKGTATCMGQSPPKHGLPNLPQTFCSQRLDDQKKAVTRSACHRKTPYIDRT